MWYAIGLEIMGFLIEKIWRMYEPSWTTEISYGAPSDAFKSSDVFVESGIVCTRKHPTTQSLSLSLFCELRNMMVMIRRMVWTRTCYGAPADAFKSSAVFEKAVIKKHGVNEIILHYSDMNCPARYFLWGSHLRGKFSYQETLLQTGRTYGPKRCTPIFIKYMGEMRD